MTELTDKQALLVSLKTQLYSATQSTTHGDTRTEYRSVSDLLKAIALLEGDIADLAGTPAGRRVKYLYQSGKGL